jgi:NAD(P)-dependent dehydrogenase (short-subunit alcohol dehydrogenase family)
MAKKICIITGGNSGIGKAAAIQIAQEDYQVIIACRNRERGETALKDIHEKSRSDSAELMIVDMSLSSSIESFAKNYLASHDQLDVLIHNAAAFDTTRKEATYTNEGMESIWATNHLGPVLLTDLLLGSLKESDQGRIITVSSKGLVIYPLLKVNIEDPEFRQRKYSVQKAYYQSKLAQVMYTYWLAQELSATSVTVNSIRVTNVKIDIESRYPNASGLAKSMYSLKSKFSISPEEMARTYTYLATSPEVVGKTGKYFDNPTHIVNSSGYSRDKDNIAAVMDLTMAYLQREQQQKTASY